MKLTLYGTTYCHLCEQAEAVLLAAAVSANPIDIADNENLLETYGTRIPVLRREDTGAELGWPFDDSTLRVFLR